MPVLHRLVAVCDSCGARKEYESEVFHDADPGWDSMDGTSDLKGSDVEHETVLPEDWKRLSSGRVICGSQSPGCS